MPPSSVCMKVGVTFFYMNINILSEDELFKLRTIIDEANKILVIGHTNPDGDALGSILTWAEYLRQQGKEAYAMVPDMFPDFLMWMPGTNNLLRYDKRPTDVERLFADADTIFCLDFNVPSRITEALGNMLIASGGRKVLIDHHLGPDIEAELTVSHPEMSSTSEMIFRLLWQLGGYESMTYNMAVTTYCGMMTDTGGFTFNSTQPEIYFIISQLLAKGIDKDKIYRNVFHTFSEHRLRMTGFVLYEKLRIMTPLRASYYILTRADLKRFRYIKGDAEGLVNMPLQMKGHRLSISLRQDTEKDNVLWVSLRSVDDFPCNEMAARFFNGGGHKNASGGKLFCSVAEAECRVREAIKAYAELL